MLGERQQLGRGGGGFAQEAIRPLHNSTSRRNVACALNPHNNVDLDHNNNKQAGEKRQMDAQLDADVGDENVAANESQPLAARLKLLLVALLVRKKGESSARGRECFCALLRLRHSNKHVADFFCVCVCVRATLITRA